MFMFASLAPSVRSWARNRRHLSKKAAGAKRVRQDGCAVAVEGVAGATADATQPRDEGDEILEWIQLRSRFGSLFKQLVESSDEEDDELDACWSRSTSSEDAASESAAGSRAAWPEQREEEAVERPRSRSPAAPAPAPTPALASPRRPPGRPRGSQGPRRMSDEDFLHGDQDAGAWVILESYGALGACSGSWERRPSPADDDAAYCLEDVDLHTDGATLMAAAQ